MKKSKSFRAYRQITVLSDTGFLFCDITILKFFYASLQKNFNISFLQINPVYNRHFFAIKVEVAE